MLSTTSGKLHFTAGNYVQEQTLSGAWPQFNGEGNLLESQSSPVEKQAFMGSVHLSHCDHSGLSASSELHWAPLLVLLMCVEDAERSVWSPSTLLVLN